MMLAALREALAGMRRTPLLTGLSVVAISLSLFVVGLFGLTAYNIHGALGELEARVEIVGYLRDGVTPEQVQIVEHELVAVPEVERITYVSKDEALSKAVVELEQFRELFADLEINPLPASMEVRLKEGRRDPATLERVAQRIGEIPFVEEVSFGQEWVEKIVSLRRIAGGATAIIGGAFAAVAGIIIATAVRISVFARREEIAIMRLVGATNGFIQRPFHLEGLLAGAAGGVIAVILTLAAFQMVSMVLLELAWLPWSWALLGVGIGSAYGVLSSAVAVRRHLGAI